MPLAAGISAVGSIGSSLIGANAASSASSQQVAAQQANARDAAKMSADYCQGQGITQQGQGVLSSILPTLTGAGTSIINSALPALQSLLTPGPNQTAALRSFQDFSRPGLGAKAVTNMARRWGWAAIRSRPGPTMRPALPAGLLEVLSTRSPGSWVRG